MCIEGEGIMYFPYFRGKQEEQFAVLESSAGSDLVVPVFEPTSVSRAPARRYERICRGGRRFGLIVNSAHGQPTPTSQAVMALLDELDVVAPNVVIPAFEIRAHTALADLVGFSQKYLNRLVLLVHRSNVLPRHALDDALRNFRVDPIHILLEGGVPLQIVRNLRGGGLVLLRDGFDRQPRNGDYPNRTAFDDLLYTYDGLGFSGMGDFAIVGDNYSPGGGPARHVALHVTEPAEGPTLVTNHFVSGPPATQGDVRRKYFDALQKLIAHVGSPPKTPFATTGVGEYEHSHSTRHFPNLGPPKRWSIAHHLELVDSELRARGVVRFL